MKVRVTAEFIAAIEALREPLSPREFRALARRTGVSEEGIEALTVGVVDPEQLHSDLQYARSLSELRDVFRRVPGGDLAFAKLVDQLTQGLQPDPSVALH